MSHYPLKSQAALEGRVGFIRSREMDPEGFHAARVQSGVEVNKQRWLCRGCSRVSTPMGLANHQLHTGHDGKTRVEDEETTPSLKEQQS